MERIVFLDRDTLRADVRRPAFAHVWRDYGETLPADVLERLRAATIAITNKVVLRAETLRQLPQLKMIAVAATGTDIIDLDYCRERGIAVSNVRGYAGHTLPELCRYRGWDDRADKTATHAAIRPRAHPRDSRAACD